MICMGIQSQVPNILPACESDCDHSCNSAISIAAYWPRGDSAASSLFGGMPGGYGLGAHHLPSAYAILGRGGSAPGFGGHTPASAPPPPPYSHSSLGTLSVAASQAASLGKSLFPLSCPPLPSLPPWRMARFWSHRLS